MKKTLIGFVAWLMIAIMAMSSIAMASLQHKETPMPVGISPEMQQMITDGKDSIAQALKLEAPKTTEQWLAMQHVFNTERDELAKRLIDEMDIQVETTTIAGVTVYVVTPPEVNMAYADKRMIHVHGGAFVFGGGLGATVEAIWLAKELGTEVISIDYRKPPIHPFPAAIDDIVAVWQKVTETQDPAATAIMGSSAGGNLTLAATLKLQQSGLPLPGALFVGTPATDLKHTTDTWYTLQGLDPLGKREGVVNGTFDVYTAGENQMNPLVSPIYAEVETFPATMFISGTRDLLLSDTVRMHRHLRAADVESALHIYDGLAHADYIRGGVLYDAPESRDAAKEINRFFKYHLAL